MTNDARARDALTKVPTATAMQLLGASKPTLMAWHKAGRLHGVKERTGRWRWDVAAYLEAEAAATQQPKKGRL